MTRLEGADVVELFECVLSSKQMDSLRQWISAKNPHDANKRYEFRFVPDSTTIDIIVKDLFLGDEINLTEPEDTDDY